MKKVALSLASGALALTLAGKAARKWQAVAKSLESRRAGRCQVLGDAAEAAPRD